MLEWRSLVWLPAYEISENGDVRRAIPCQTHPAGFMPKGHVDKYGYRKYKLTFPDGRKKSVSAHRLCCEAFHGPAPEGKPDVGHWDGVPTNNHHSNLRWVTQKENGADRVRHRALGVPIVASMDRAQRGFCLKPDRPAPMLGSPRISLAEVARIRSAPNGRARNKVAAEIGISRMHAWRITVGKARNSIAGDTSQAVSS